MVTFRNVNEETQKIEIINAQSEDMVHYFKDMIDKFDIIDEERSPSNFTIHDAKNSMVDSLIIVSKIFTEFLFIKNLFEMEKDCLKLEKEAFDLKSSIFFTLDSIMSLKKES